MRTPAPPPPDQLADFADRAILLRPKEYMGRDTVHGHRVVLVCETIVPTPERGPGKYLNLGDKDIFWQTVQRQLDESIGEWVLGRLHKGTESNERAWMLLDPAGDDVEHGEAVLASLKDF